MMNNDEGFKQRWEFRRKEDDADSSSSEGSKSVDKRLQLVYTLAENEETESAKCDEPDKFGDKNSFGPRPAKMLKKSTGSSKKKNTVVPNDKRDENKKRKIRSSEMGRMFEDLKAFAGSVIHELIVAREEMSQQMREEVRKFAADSHKRKKVVLKQTKKAQPQMKEKPRKRPRASAKASKKSNAGTTDGGDSAKAVKGTRKFVKVPSSDTGDDQKSLKGNAVSELGKCPQSEMPKGENVKPAMASDRVVSMPFLALPAVMPKPQLQNQRNNLGSKIETGKNQFTTIPYFMARSGTGIGFPVTLHQGNAVGLRRNSSNPAALPDYILANTFSGSHDQHVYMAAALRNKQ